MPPAQIEIGFADHRRRSHPNRTAGGGNSPVQGGLSSSIGREVLEEFRSTTSTVPILAMDLESDPVGSSMVVSLAHPGDNITTLATASATKVKSEAEGVRNDRN
jgi:hypothetical protein